MSEFVDVASVEEIPKEEGRAFPVGDILVAVFQLADGTFRAIDDACPHQGASLAEGHVCGEEVSCPWHAWRFKTTDGTWADNPRLKVNAYEVKVENGRVMVCTQPKPTEDS